MDTLMNKQAKRLIVLAVGIIVSTHAAQTQTTNSINMSIASDREPPGSTTSTFIDHKSNTVIYSNSVSGSNWTLKINYPPPPIALPYTYKDADTGIIFYVESDGHHVAALDKNGTILWFKQPALDGNLPPYSATRPQPNPLIVWFGALTENQSERLKKTGSGKFIGISFSSRQFGVLDVKNGDFTFQGQD